MSNMTGNNPRAYVKKGGKQVGFVYEVNGSKEQLDEYKKAQGDNYVEENGKPLFFVGGNYGGKEIGIEIGANRDGVAQAYGRTELDTLEKLIESTTNPTKRRSLERQYDSIVADQTAEALELVAEFSARSKKAAESASPLGTM